MLSALRARVAAKVLSPALRQVHCSAARLTIQRHERATHAAVVQIPARQGYGMRGLSAVAPTIETVNGDAGGAAAVLGVAALVDRVLALPELPAPWARRLVSASETDPAGPLRVLVLASENVGRNALVNNLLGYPEGKAVVSEEWGAERAPDGSEQEVRLRPGSTPWAEDRTANVHTITIPEPVLKGVEWTLAPPLTDAKVSGSLESLVAKHDALLVVTDIASPLGSAAEKTVLRLTPGKPVLVAVDGVERLNLEQQEVPRVVEMARYRAGQADLTISPISTRRATLAQYMSATPSSVPSDMETSGVLALRSALSQLVDKRDTIKRAGQLSLCAAALEAIETDLSLAKDAIQALDAGFQKRVVAHVVAEQDRLLTEFHKDDLQALAMALTQLRTQIRAFFDKTPALSLLYRLDTLDDTLRAHLQSHALSELEARMAFAAGKLSEAIRSTYRSVQDAVRDMHASASRALTAVGGKDGQATGTPTKSATPTGPTTLEPMLALLDRVGTLVAREAATQAPSRTPVVPPFALSNVVWTYRSQFERGDFVGHVHARAEQLIVRAAAFQVLSFGGAAFAWMHAAADPVHAAIGATAAVSATLVWLRLRWRAFEDAFVHSTDGVQDGLRKELAEKYRVLVQEKLTQPMAVAGELYDQAVAELAEDLELRRVQVKELRARVAQLQTEGGP